MTEIPLTASSKFIVLSDCHRGNGGAGDEFARNSLIYKCALEYYLEEGFTYIELGDAEELWENDDFLQIYITHTSVYDLLRRFHDPDPARTRYLKVWGNHDADWQDDPAPMAALFPGIRLHEALRLGPILLLHGHQADPSCCGPGARVSRFLVRKVWSGLQQFGIGDPTRAAENPGLCDKIDETLYQLAKGEDKAGLLSKIGRQDNISAEKGDRTPAFPSIIVAGHTHRPAFANLSLTERRLLESGVGALGVRHKVKADPAYYNSGSCIHPRCITGIEITGPENKPAFALIKWGYAATDESAPAGQKEYRLTIKREILEC